MKKTVIIFVGFMLYSNFAFSQFKLEIEVADIKNDEGKIMLQFFDENEKTLKQDMGQIKEKKCLFTISDLKPGKYAIRYFHDENNNGQLDTGTFGIPKEGYGFSNNATGSFGPPPFSKWLFEVKGDTKIVLNPNY